MCAPRNLIDFLKKLKLNNFFQ